jgi:prophage regulatory protein
LYRAIEQGEFPRQVTISTNSVAWLEAEVEAWIQTRLAQRDSRGQQP